MVSPELEDDASSPFTIVMGTRRRRGPILDEEDVEEPMFTGAFCGAKKSGI